MGGLQKSIVGRLWYSLNLSMGTQDGALGTPRHLILSKGINGNKPTVQRITSRGRFSMLTFAKKIQENVMVLNSSCLIADDPIESHYQVKDCHDQPNFFPHFANNRLV